MDVKSGQWNLLKKNVFCTLPEVFIIEGILMLWSLSLWNRHEVSIKVDSCYKRNVKNNKIKLINKWVFIDARNAIW